MQAQPLLSFEGVTKSYHDFFLRRLKPALNGLDLRVEAGEIVGLLGPNGSGKSTALSIAVGLLKHDSGEVRLFGGSPKTASNRRHLAFLPEENANYPGLTGRLNLELHARLLGFGRAAARGLADELLERVGLGDAGNKRASAYSKGMGRRLGLATCLLGDPRLILLDEPTSGLDPLGTELVREILVECRQQGRGVLLSSHLLSEIEGVCDRIVVMSEGRVICQGSAASLLTDHSRLDLSLGNATPDLEAELRDLLEKRGTDYQLGPAAKPLAALYRELFLANDPQAKQEQAKADRP